ncbi:amino acid adenylation domain-containing protein [Roseivirga sp. BDSF3-8]|uniref:amino acid adenylation domain-containing protein n=1 Tax=Roseivirga sp. BDSF3-8 TaxID=3241598 RepID=UPI0035318C6E
MYSLIEELKRNKIDVSLDGDNLKLHFDGDNIDPALLEKLKENKENLIAFFKKFSPQANKINIQPVEKADSYPLSNAQRRLWLASQSEESSVAYNVPNAVELKGDYDIKHFENAVKAVIAHHEILRTVFRVNETGEVRQIILSPEEGNFTIDYKDFRTEENPEHAARTFIAGDSHKPFNLTEGPLIRAGLFQVADDSYLFYYNLHHIVSDGWSQRVLTQNVMKYYQAFVQGKQPVVRPLKIQYKDYAVWQLNQLETEDYQHHKDYWHSQFRNSVAQLDLPATKSRPRIKTHNGRKLATRVSPEIINKLRKFTTEEGGSLFMGLLAAWKVLLYRYTGETDIVIGNPVSGRDHSDLKEQIGFYVNMLALRNQVDGTDAFRKFFSKVKSSTLSATEHQAYPFDKLLEDLKIERNYARSPLFDIKVDFHGVANYGYTFGYDEIKDHGPTVSKFDLELFLAEHEGGVDLALSFNRDVYDPALMEKFLVHYKAMISSLVANPDQVINRVDYLLDEEKEFLLQHNHKTIDYPADETFIDLFTKQVKDRPEAIAVQFEGNKLTYAELNEKADRVANYLLNDSQLKKGDYVGIYMDMSEYFIISIMGVLKAGCIYVPVDTGFPTSRKQHIVEDSGLSLIITDTSFMFEIDFYFGDMFAIDVELEEVEIKEADINLCGADDLAYVIYTSGSTGQPKGVLISHINVVDYLHGLVKRLHLKAGYSYGLMSTPAADLGNTVLFGALATSGALHLFSKKNLTDSVVLSGYFAKEKIDVIKIVPSHWLSLCNGKNLVLPEKVIIFGGEVLPKAVIQKINNSQSAVTIFNHYGPTETTIGKLMYEVERARNYETVPVGNVFSNSEIFVLDSRKELLPVGVSGELHIGGAGLAQGYLNAPGLTEAKFIPHPYKEGKRLYNTGDLVKWLPDGNIAFVGRKDFQVKIRGYRIELGEIEAVLSGIKGVKNAVVLAYEKEGMAKQLVAYLAVDGEMEQDEIQKHLSNTLPGYMVPNHFVQLGEIPLTENGKINRKALPDPFEDEVREYIAPANEIESKLVQIWQDTIGIERVGTSDNFFKIGGDSLIAIKMISIYHKTFNISITINDIFESPVLIDHVKFVERGSKAHMKQISRVEEAESYPLSNSQLRLWLVSQMEQSSVAYNMPKSVLLEGKYDTDKFTQAVYAVIDRHEILRTVFKYNLENEVRQYIRSREELGFNIPRVDLSGETDPQKASELYIAEDSYKPFDLKTGPLIRAAIIRLSDERHVFYYNMHHIISDQLSMQVMARDVSAFYQAFMAGDTPELPVLNIQFKDYTGWQAEQMASLDFQLHKDYWLGQFKEPVSAIDLPSLKKRPAVKTYRGKSLAVRVSEKTTSRLRDFMVARDGSLFMGLLAAFKVMVYHYTGERDITVGNIVAGREHADLEDQIGFYINTLALRNKIDAFSSFDFICQQIKENTLRAFKHQAYPFDQLIDDLGIQRDMARSPLFDILIDYHGVSGSHYTFSHTDDILDLGECMVKFDMEVHLTEVDNGVNVVIMYNDDVYETAVISDFLKHYKILLNMMLDKPQRHVSIMNFLTEKENELLQKEYNNTDFEYPEALTVIDVIQKQAKQTPEAVAIEYGEGTLTYRELDSWSDKLAKYLLAKGLKKEELVPLCLGRSPEMIISILGIMKAGGAYVPVDPAYPEQRIAFVLEDTRARFAVSERNAVNALENYPTLEVIEIGKVLTQTVSEEAEISLPSTGQLAYVIYTSGSTGKSKGVMVEHKPLTNFLYSMKDYLSFGSDLRLLSLTTFTFDISILEFMSPLMWGGRLILISDEEHKDPALIASAIKAKAPNCIQATPSHWQMLLNYDWGYSNIKLLSGGEAISDELKQQLLSRTDELWNLYGPTETTIWSCISRLRADEKVTIGKPIGNTRVYVLNERLALAPAGTAGELCIGGDGVARGYLNRQVLTMDKFVNNPFRKGEKIYRTGDLVKWLPDGQLEFIGREDSQVKIRGHRIELGEIENALATKEEVGLNAVVVKDTGTGQKDLVAYYTSSELLKASALRTHLLEHIPSYMVPAYFVALEEMPLTANGKVDRKALPDPAEMDMDSGVEYVAPRNDTEAQLATIWETVLDRQDIGLKGDFFDLGGHSLRAVRLINEYYKAFDIKLTMADVFANRILESHVSLLAKAERTQYAQIPALPSQDDYPISDAQRRLWVISQFKEQSASYNMPNQVYLDGEYDLEKLRYAVLSLMKRHEILRTVFREDEEGNIRQVVLDVNDMDFDIGYHDYASTGNSEANVREYIREDAYKPFDLANGPLIRAAILKVSEAGYVFYYNMHHIISDGWSLDIIARDVQAYYQHYAAEAPLGLPELTIQYKDYAAWQLERLASDDFWEHKKFWLSRLQGELPVLEMPGYEQRPARKTTNGRRISLLIGEDDNRAINSFVAEQQGTLFMYLLSSLNVLLHRYTGQDDIIIGSPVAGRGHNELEHQIGFYVNTLPLRTGLDSRDTFPAFFNKVKEDVIEAYGHQEYPFDRLVEDLNLQRDTSRNAIFDVLLILQNTSDSNEVTLPFSEGTDLIERGDVKVNYDLEFTFKEFKNGLKLDLSYNEDIYSDEFIKSFAGHFRSLIKQLGETHNVQLGAVDLLGAEEAKRLAEHNHTTVTYPEEQTVIDLLRIQVQKTPDQRAVVSEQASLTYSDIDKMSDSLAGRLSETNDQTPVGVLLARSAESVISLLGIMKSGRVYVPIDSTYPVERIKFILKDAGITQLVADTSLEVVQTIKEDVSFIDSTSLQNRSDNIVNHCNLNDNAFIIYTSGSTGTPKGVVQTHKMLRNLINWESSASGIDRRGKHLQYNSFSFDVSVQDVFASLTNGGELHIVNENQKLDFIALRQYVIQNSLEVLSFPYSAMVSFYSINQPDDFVGHSIKQVISSGEQLVLTEGLKAFLEDNPEVELHNHYGPSETHVVTHYVYTSSQTQKVSHHLPIGKPVSNTAVYILNNMFQPQPAGAIGEIYIGGHNLADGYLNREELTSQRFIENPFRTGELLYKTGDNGRWLPDGNIEYFGRIDKQVKVRGYRIELSEIEAVLDQIDNIKKSIVVAVEGREGLKQLIAYVVTDEAPDGKALHAKLQEYLPDYMIPRVFVPISEIPLTSNGKIDKNALPKPQAGIGTQEKYVAPSTETEEKITAIWQEVLGIDKIGVKDNFFELGGNSLDLVKITSKIRKKLELVIEIQTLFEFSTISDLAFHIDYTLKQDDIENSYQSLNEIEL